MRVRVAMLSLGRRISARMSVKGRYSHLSIRQRLISNSAKHKQTSSRHVQRIGLPSRPMSAGKCSWRRIPSPSKMPTNEPPKPR